MSSVGLFYLQSTASAFELAHELVDLRDLINKEAGTLKSFF